MRPTHPSFSKLFNVALILAVLLGAAFTSTSSQKPGTVRLIVKTAKGLSRAQQQQALTGHGGNVKSSITPLDLHVVEVPQQAASAVAKQLESVPGIVRVETDHQRRWQSAPSDTSYSSQWALPKIGWDQVYGSVETHALTSVAVLDTGVDASHPDLVGSLVTGTSIIDDSNGATDGNGHGTWVAGIIAAQTNNAEGIAGVGYSQVQVMPVKVLDSDGFGQDSDIIEGLTWAADHGASVIVMAFSNPGFSPALQEAIDYAWSKNIVLVAAAGNDANDAPTFPAGDAGVVGVSATDQNDQLADTSNFGQSIFLAAPGVGILSTYKDGGLVTWNGTSGSAALVAGSAALIRAVDPTLSNGAVVGRLARNADSAGTQEQTGNGRINLARAIADTTTDEIKPSGADPVGNGGPFVGPYKIAAANFKFSDGTGDVCAGGSNQYQTQATGANFGQKVCATATGLGSGNGTVVVDWVSPGGSIFTQVIATANGSFDAIRIPNAPGLWTLNVYPTAADELAKTNSMGGGTFWVKAGIPPHLKFTSSAFNVSANTCSPAITVQLQDSSNAPVSPSFATTVILTSSSSGPKAFYSNAGCTTVITTIDIPANQSTTPGFYYKDSALGTPTLTASASGITSDTQIETIGIIPTTTSINAPTITYNVNGSVTVTVSSGNGTPTGNVSLTVDGGSPITQALTAGSSVFTLTSPIAGDHPLSANYAAQGIFGASATTGNLHVNKASSTVTVDCTAGAPHAYTGSAQTPCTAEATGVGMSPVDVTASLVYGSNTNVGPATANASWGGDTNHTGNTGSGGFSITLATSTVTVDCTPGAPHTYTGLAQTPCTAQATGVGMSPVNVTASLTYSANINVGPVTANASWGGDSNHTGNTGSGGFSITQATSTVTVDCTPGAPHTYTGLAQTPCTAQATGVGMSPVNVTASLTYSANINVGPVTANASWGGDSNHTGNTGSGGFSITQATSTVTVTCTTGAPHTYTASAQTPCTAQATGVGMSPVDVTASLTYSANINVGPVTANASWGGDSNHTGNTGSGGFSITQAGSTMLVTFESGPYVFRNSNFTATAFLSGPGLNVSWPVSYTGDCKNVTSNNGCSASASYPGDLNHTLSSDNKSITITPAPTTTRLGNTNGTYPSSSYGQAVDLRVTVTSNTGGSIPEGSITLLVHCKTNENATDDATCVNGTFPIGPLAVGSLTSGQLDINGITSLPVGGPRYVKAIFTPNANWSSTSAATLAPDLSDGIVSDPILPGYNCTGSGSSKTCTGSANFLNHEVTKANAVIDVTPYNVPFDNSSHTASGSATGVNNENLSGLLHLGATAHTTAGDYPSDGWTFDGNDNYNATSGSVHDIIGQIGSTVTVDCTAGAPHTYTGSAQSPCTAQATGVGMAPVDVTASINYTDDHTNVGTAHVTASWAGDANHTGNNGAGDFAITQAGSTVTVDCTPGAPHTYTGSAQTPCTAQATGAGMSAVNVTGSINYTDNHTDVGTAHVTASWAGDANHTGNNGAGDFAITQAGSTVTVDCTPGAPHTYTGSAQTPCTAQATGAGMSAVNVTGSINYTDNNTDVGTAHVTASWVGDANHTGNNGAGDFAITQAGSTVTVDCTPGAPHTYTGSAQTPCTAQATGAGMSAVNVTGSINYTDNNTDVGTAHVTASWAGDANHTGNNGAGDFAITQAGSTVTVDCTPGAPHTYTGSAQTPCTAQATGAGMSAVNVTGSINYTDNHTDVGTAHVTASWAGDANHTGNNGAGDFAITQAGSTVTVDCTPGAPHTYTGSAQTPCTAQATGAGMSAVNVTGSINYTDNHTDVGTAHVTASWAGDANHTGNNGAGDFAITQAGSTVTVDCTPGAPHTYTGSAQTPCTAQATGAGMSAVNVTGSINYTDNHTDVGTAHVTASWAGDANHTGNNGAGDFAITQAGSTVTVDCTPGAPHTYTGSAQTPCTAQATGAGMSAVNVTGSINYTDNHTDVGTAHVTASWAGDANHTGNNGAGDFAITQAGSTVTVDCTPGAPHTYTGSAQTPCTAQATGAGMSAVNVTGSINYTDNHTDVGTAHVTASWAGDANHTGNNGGGSFYISKAGSTVTVDCTAGAPHTYTGSAQTPCTAQATGAGMIPVNVTGSINYTDNHTDVGTAHVTASWAGDANHTGNNGAGDFAITQAGSTVTVDCTPGAPHTYTGSAQTPCTAQATGAGMIAVNVTGSINYTDNNTDVGTAHVTASWAGDANHTGNNGAGDFAITQAGSTVTVDCTPGAPHTYTGSAQTPCTAQATGAGMSAVNVTGSINYTDNHTDVGTAHVTASWAGDANHTGNNGAGDFAITVALSTVTVTCGGPYVYTSSAQTPCTAQATGAGMSPVNVTLSINYTDDHTNVGTAHVTASWDGDANHTGSNGAGSFVITSAKVTTLLQPCGPYNSGTGCQVNKLGEYIWLSTVVTNNSNTVKPTGSVTFTIFTDGTGTTPIGPYFPVTINLADGSTSGGSPLAGTVTAGPGANQWTVKAPQPAVNILPEGVRMVTAVYNPGANFAKDSVNPYDSILTPASYLNQVSYPGGPYGAATDISNAYRAAFIHVVTPNTTITLNLSGYSFTDNNGPHSFVVYDCIHNKFSGTLTYTGPNGFSVANKSIVVTIGSQSVTVTTDASGNFTGSLTITQAPGSVTASASFAGDATPLSAASTSSSVTIQPDTNVVPVKDSATLYTGSRFFWTTSPTSSTATLTLTATIADGGGCNPDIAKAKVSFFISDDGNTYRAVSSAQNLPVGYVDPNDKSVGTAAAISQYDLGKNQSATLWVKVVVGGWYDYHADTYNVPVTLAKPGQINTLLAGGTLKNDGSSIAGLTGFPASGYMGTAALAGGSTDFAGQVTYTKNLTNPQGQLQVTIHSYNKPDGSLDTVPHTYWIKSNAIAELSVKNGMASFSSKTNVYEITGGNKNGLDGGGTMNFTFTPMGGTYQVTTSSGATKLINCTNTNGCASIVVFRSNGIGGGVWFSNAWGIAAPGSLPQTIEQKLYNGSTYIQ